ncbi:MAG: hypothetical protein GXP22_06085 [Gammaproteobacteria bacterium]|nr:hypothetical protein [Gammaproteobacteria bacterium]
MNMIELHGREIKVTLSKKAQRALAQRDQPLQVEMQLYFSCLIKKQVRFQDTISDDAVDAAPGLKISFRPICTAQCRLVDANDEVPTMTMPITNPQAFTPHWFYLDYKSQQWCGEFGYT